jgi:hypothetical protein
MKRTVLESTPYEGLKSGSHLDVEVVRPDRALLAVA